MVHVSETCEPMAPHLMTPVHTTAATVHEAQCPAPIQQALVEQALPPSEHLVDAAYIGAAWLVQSRDEHGITWRGPTRPSPGWQAHVDGAYTLDQVEVDWAQRRVRCPQGKWSDAWWEHGAQASCRPIIVEFAREDCQACPARTICTRAQQQGRRVRLPPRRNMRRLKRPGPGMPVRRGSRAISGGPESKGRCPRACAALGCGAPDSGASRRPTYNTWRRPRR